MPGDEAPAPRPSPLLRAPWFAVLLALLILQRCFHLGETIDGSHSGRQCDTLWYALDIYRNGLDHVLRPGVCWMGAHETLALECPLPEALMALAFRVLGPRLLWARLIVLLSFLGSAWYLHRIVEYLRGRRTARLATLLYAAMPLALVFSRAVHVDFAAVFCAHAMLYHLVRGYDEGSTRRVALGALFGTLAFLIKAPYAFYLFLPFAFHALRQPKLRALARWSPLLLIMVLAFGTWRWHAGRVNAAAPDWSFIPNYFKFTEMGWWYYGPLSSRLDPRAWLALGRRTVNETCGALGLYLLLIGLIVRPADPRAVGFFRLWFLGVLAYVAIFFNLNVIHDYYQIPFLAPVAFFLALALEWLFLDRAGPLTTVRSALPLALTLLLLAGGYVRTAETYHYAVDHVVVSAGRAIREHTPPDALVIGSLRRDQAWWFDPRLLCRADRRGWAIPLRHLSEAVIGGLAREGATHLAIVTDAPLPPNLDAVLGPLSWQEFPLSDRSWHLFLYRLPARLGN